MPVSIADYVAQVREQSIAGIDIPRRELERGLSTLVLNDDTLRRIGWAVRSHKPMMIHGESGNGKTTVAHNVGNIVGGTVLVPYAVEIVGQIVRVFDASKHEPVRDDADGDDIDALLRPRPDGRWVRVQRPVIWAGGELTRHSLELILDADTRLYEAPLQLKANGGTLIIDDLGRQQIPAVQLLNRWIVALESGADHLTLHTGQTVEVPFDVLLVFSTNLPPESLADEAFLRRIRHKIEIGNPSNEEFREIFKRVSEAKKVAYDDRGLAYPIQERYIKRNRPLRANHPRDICEQILDVAGFLGTEPALSKELIDRACESYFVEL